MLLLRSSPFPNSLSPFGNIFSVFFRMVGTELQMINPTSFFRYLKGRCHGIYHIFVVSKHRDFIFGVQVDRSHSQPTDDKPSLKGGGYVT